MKMVSRTPSAFDLWWIFGAKAEGDVESVYIKLVYWTLSTFSLQWTFGAQTEYDVPNKHF